MIGFRDVNSILQGRAVLENINLQIVDGEWVALTGANGSGKSTLCSLAAELRRPDAGSVDIDPAGENAVPVAIAMQNPDSQFITTTVRREIHFGMENINLPFGLKEERFRESVSIFELQGLLDRNPHTLSGGEKQRLLLATVWVMNPRHLILDEPLTFLDAVSRERVVEAVREHFHDRGKAVLWATLDRAEIGYADRVLFLADGSVTGYGDPDEFLESGPGGIVVGNDRSGSPRKATEPGDKLYETVVEMEDMAISYPDSGFCLRIDRLNIRRGETVGITGPVGSGKSTLLASCAGLIPPESGTVRVFGKKAGSAGDFQAQRVAVLFQTPEEGFFAETVEEEVALGYRSFYGDQGAGEAVREAMETAGIDYETFSKRSPHRLSQGEKRLCALASVIILKAELYILDEPSLFLDAEARDNLERALRRLIGPETAVIMASHDSSLISRMTDRTIELHSPGEAPGGVSGF
ncbi:MAG: ABC transporter ATP-binding protein [Candidatus Krumholzibacteriales bacterium]